MMTPDKKMFRIPDQKRQFFKTDSILQGLQNSMVTKPQRNQFNSQLLSNFNQIKDLLKQRKSLLKAKHQHMMIKNKQKLYSINQAKEQDLKNQAKMLNDKSIMQLVDQAESLSRSKNLLAKVAQIKNMPNFQATQRSNGKQFWDKSREIDRQKKKKAQLYTSQYKQLTDLNQKQRIIFSQIQKFQNQILFHLTKGRNDPDHVRRAERLNEQIQKRKGFLRQLKSQKTKIKESVRKIIQEILMFNEQGEKIYKFRNKDIDEIFSGSVNIAEYDTLTNALQKITTSRTMGKVDNFKGGIDLSQFYKNYDLFLQQLQRIKQDEDHVFGILNDQLKDNIKNAIMQKALLSGVPYKIDQNQLIKRLKDYRKLLLDLNQQKLRNDTSIAILNQMSSMLYPKKKDYQTEDVRREDLKRQLKRLFLLNEQIQSKQKQFRDFNFKMQQLLHKRNGIQADINVLASKGNLPQYKNKMRELEEINKTISQKNDIALKEQVNRMEIQLNDSFNMIYDKYEDLIKQVEVQQQQPSLGVFLSKLQKRLTLI